MRPALLTLAMLALLAAPVEAARAPLLLVVENGKGRIDRISPRSGAVRVVAAGFAKAVAATRLSNGDVLVSDDTRLVRVSPNGSRHRAATAPEQIGQVASSSDGRAAFVTETALYVVSAAGKTRRLLSGLAGPHGVAFNRAGSILVADTGHGVVKSVDAHGRARALIRVVQPRGIAVAANGEGFVVDATTHRVIEFSPAGRRIRALNHRFLDPYAVSVSASGTVYVVETSEAGWLVRIGEHGRTTTIPTGP